MQGGGAGNAPGRALSAPRRALNGERWSAGTATPSAELGAGLAPQSPSPHLLGVFQAWLRNLSSRLLPITGGPVQGQKAAQPAPSPAAPPRPGTLSSRLSFTEQGQPLSGTPTPDTRTCPGLRRAGCNWRRSTPCWSLGNCFPREPTREGPHWKWGKGPDSSAEPDSGTQKEIGRRGEQEGRLQPSMTSTWPRVLQGDPLGSHPRCFRGPDPQGCLNTQKVPACPPWPHRSKRRAAVGRCKGGGRPSKTERRQGVSRHWEGRIRDKPGFPTQGETLNTLT